ncbi:hypothetical protein ACHAW6_003783 [Cyclotella cf. meneghiniana]
MRNYQVPIAFLCVASAFQSPPLRKRCTHRSTGHAPFDSSAPTHLRDASARNNSDNEYALPLPLKPKGIVFDMDGTLIQHSIDFASMRRRIYEVADSDPIGKDLERTCVLALANQLSIEGRRKAEEIFADIEQRALMEMKLMPGGIELIQFLRENGLKRAVLTRNLEKNVHFMQRLYLDQMEGDEESLFHPIVARDTVAGDQSEELLRAKPAPDGILHICSVWDCNPSEVIMVGDSINDDIAAANRAGCGGAVLLTQPDGSTLDTDSGYAVGISEEEILERTPSLCVESLSELKMCLKVLLNEQNIQAQSVQSDEIESEGGRFVYSSMQGYAIDIPSIGVKRV